MICMTFVPSKNPTKQHTHVQTPRDREQMKLQHWHIGRMVRSRPEPPQWPLSFPELYCWERGFCATTTTNKMHHARGACWFTIATSRSIAMTPFSSFGRTVSQRMCKQKSENWLKSLSTPSQQFDPKASAWCFSYHYYLTRAPRSASSQGMQDESGAKSGKWLAEFAHVVSTSFSILFS